MTSQLGEDKQITFFLLWNILTPSPENHGILQACVTEIYATNCGNHQAEPLSEIQSSLRKRHDMSRCERRKKEVKDEKYLRMFINPEQLSTAFESGEYLFAIQDIWAKGGWGDHNIEGQCSVGKGVRMKIEK